MYDTDQHEIFMDSIDEKLLLSARKSCKDLVKSLKAISFNI